MLKIKFFFQQSWLLLVSSFCFGLLIAVANSAWLPIIEQNKKDKFDNLMRGLITDANTFEIVIEKLEIPVQKGRVEKTNVYKALDSQGKILGFAFVAAGSGFADKIELVIAVDQKCEKFLGFKTLSCNETPGFGSKIKEDFFSGQFKSAPAEKLELVKAGNPQEVDNKIVAISGATVTSTAVVNMFNIYIDKVKQELQKKGLF